MPASTAADVRGPFVDMSSAWGLTRPHTGGGLEKRYIVEAKGGGAALLDAEGDGDLDIYWVNGARLEEPERGGGECPLPQRWRNRLYRCRRCARGAGLRLGNGGAERRFRQRWRCRLVRHVPAARISSTATMAGGALPMSRPGQEWRRRSGARGRRWEISTWTATSICTLPTMSNFELETTRPLGAQWKGRDVFVGPCQPAGGARPVLSE